VSKAVERAVAFWRKGDRHLGSGALSRSGPRDDGRDAEACFTGSGSGASSQYAAHSPHAEHVKSTMRRATGQI